MDFQKLITRYKQFGGMRLVWEYAKFGALWPAVKAGVRCVVKRQSFKAVYPVVLEKVEPVLVNEYGSIVQEFKGSRLNYNYNYNYNTNASTSSGTDKKAIWWCWLQGLEAAPPIVKACYNSLVREFKGSKVQEVQGCGHSTGSGTGYEIKVIDEKNWRDYVELPGYIVEKWEKGRIPAAMFSDLLRVELLVKYGGTWIDSTVLYTGPKHQDSGFKFQEYLDADLFVFQYTKPECVPVSMSNWFITACRNNEVLMVLREMLHAYWRDYDCVLDYYIFHLFFAMISKEYPEQMAAMPYAQSQRSIALMKHLGARFEQSQWDSLVSRVCFHKLSFRLPESFLRDKSNYLNHILTTYHPESNN